ATHHCFAFQSNSPSVQYKRIERSQMKYLDLTFNAPAENLACDEALLDLCEQGLEDEILRVWEASQHFVVVGYGNKISSEVNLEACAAAQVPVFRRCTGGG